MEGCLLIEMSVVRKVGICVILGAAFILSGCSVTEPSGGEGSADSGPPEVVAAADVDPQAIQKIDDLLGQPPAVLQAGQVAVARCMEAKGYEDKAGARDNRSVRDLALPSPITVGQARISGYASSDPSETEPAGEASGPGAAAARMGTPDAEQISVAGGAIMMPSDGCMAKSYEELYGSAEDGLVLNGGLEAQANIYVNEALFDDGLLAKDKEWSTCMKDDHGMDYENPTVIEPEAGDAMVDVAVADALCRENVGYEAAMTSALNKYLTSFLDDNQGLIDQASRAKTAAERNAPEILGR